LPRPRCSPLPSDMFVSGAMHSGSLRPSGDRLDRCVPSTAAALLSVSVALRSSIANGHRSSRAAMMPMRLGSSLGLGPMRAPLQPFCRRCLLEHDVVFQPVREVPFGPPEFALEPALRASSRCTSSWRSSNFRNALCNLSRISVISDGVMVVH
jgi:hypothetical protein